MQTPNTLTFLEKSQYILVLLCFLSFLQCNSNETSGSEGDAEENAPSQLVWNALNEQVSVSLPALDSSSVSLAKKYAPLYYSILGTENHAFGQPDSLFKLADTVAAAHPYQRNVGVEVFGWHRHSRNNEISEYNLKLLTTLAFFSYDIDDATGKENDPDTFKKWKNSELIDSAKANGCKVLLTITYFGDKAGDNSTLQFLDRKDIQDTTIMRVREYLTEKGADGVDVNFELIPRGYRDKFTDFVKRLKEGISKDNKDYIINIDLLNVNRAKVFDLPALRKYANTFVIMGYDYNGSFSSAPGPISPLYIEDDAVNRYKDNLKKSVDEYLKDLLPEELILGLPYYGGAWTELGQDSFSFEYLTYQQIRAKLQIPSILDSLRYFPNSVSNRLTYKNENGENVIVWFDGPNTLAKKYEWIKNEKKLRGVAVWALGYDKGSSDLWALLGEHFSVQRYAGTPRQPFSFISFVHNYKNVLIINLMFLVTFMIIGLASAAFNWKVREEFFANKTFRLIYILGIFLFAFLAISIRDFEFGRNTYLLIGLGLGAIIGFTVTFFFERERKHIPDSVNDKKRVA